MRISFLFQVRKIRKVKPLKADDLLADAPALPTKSTTKREPRESTLHMNGGSTNTRIKKGVKDEPMDEDFSLDTDDLPRK